MTTPTKRAPSSSHSLNSAPLRSASTNRGGFSPFPCRSVEPPLPTGLSSARVPQNRRVGTRRITVDERRARLARRHHLVPSTRTDDVAVIADSVVALHSSDPVSVFLSVLA